MPSTEPALADAGQAAALTDTHPLLRDIGFVVFQKCFFLKFLLTSLFYALSSSSCAMLAIETASPEETGERALKDLTFFGGLFGTVLTFSHHVVPNINLCRLLFMRQSNSLLDNCKPPRR